MSLLSTQNASNPKHMLIPLVLMLLLWAGGVFFWLRFDALLALLFFGYVGLLVGVGIGGYIAMPPRSRPMARDRIMLAVGTLLLTVALLSDHGNMQLEGLFFAVLGVSAPWIVLHYLVAKLVGPLVFGRIWCGWACWYGMILEHLPFEFSRYRRTGPLNLLRYAIFVALFAGVAMLVVGFEYMGGALGQSGLVWFVVGLAIYYLVGIVMALLLRDNRAFCKYACPISVPMKAAARYSLLKVKATTAEHCTPTCEACVELCPMNIRVKDYALSGQRVLSTECTLCQTCINVCPEGVLTLSLGFDGGGPGHIDTEPPRRR